MTFAEPVDSENFGIGEVMNPSKHMPALDGLRGTAILMVVFSHVAMGKYAAQAIFQNTWGVPPTFSCSNWLSRIGGDAGDGVQLFFVVSAFTLTLRMAKGSDELLHYAIRRIARVGPAYWIAGAVYTLVAGLAPRLYAPNGVTAWDIIVAAVFGSAWQGGAP